MARFSAFLRQPASPADRLAQARDADYWRGLDVTLAVARDNPPVVGENPDVSTRHADLLRDGYFLAPALLPPSSLAPVLQAVRAVGAHGWPAVFAFMFDAPWHLLRHAGLHGLMQGLLGPRYRQLPRVWVHAVPNVEGARGWPPHVDYPSVPPPPDGVPDRLTAWLALTDATVDNGCLQVIPRGRAPALVRQFATLQRLPMDDVITLLHAVQAVPAPAGSVVGWGFDLVHWGAVSTGRAAGPRVAISVELLAQGALPRADELPLLEPESGIPSFAARLQLVGLALLAFGGDAAREPLAHQHLELGRALVRR